MLLRLLRDHLRPYRGPIAVVVVLQVVQVLCSLSLPALNADVIDRGIRTGDVDHIRRTGGWMLAVTCVQVAATAVAVRVGARTATSFGRDLRRAVFEHAGRLSDRDLGVLGAATLLTRTTNDVQQVQMLVVMSFSMVVAAPITAVGGVVMALRHDVVLSGLLLVVVPLLASVLAVVISRLHPLFRDVQDRVDTLTRVVREQVSGVRVVRAFVKDAAEQERFARANDELYTVSLQAGRLMTSMFPLMQLVLSVSTVAVWWFGALRVRDGAIEVGEVVAMTTYLVQILMSVLVASIVFMVLPRAQVSAERIAEVLDLVPTVGPPTDPVHPPRGAGTVELRGAGLAHPGAAEKVLDGVDLLARPGETVAIVGPTGAGKTTLLSLVARLLDVTEGEVRVAGADVRRMDPQDLWSRIGLVPQRAHLFRGTVASNLRLGDEDATDERLWEALETAQAADFVRALPDGLEAPVAQGGTTFSGGQRQRLAVARALVRRPEIYLLDDCFSALDAATDAALRTALRAATREATVLVVAQRVSTVRDADRIVVLDAGRVVGTGRHAELLRTCATYREICASQTGAEELA